MRLLVANRTALAEGNMAVSALSRWRNFRLHLNRPNTITGSRDNIEAHYDLSAEFYRTFLGETMTYSCALFAGPGDTLEQAQRAKLRSVIDKARIRREHHVLEIGCGWGSLAVQAVRETGCRWTGITISRTQYEHARSLVQREGLEDRITIALEDYRTVRGSYDRIVSVEMIEAVGHEHLGEFFSCCDRLLRPDGIMCIQSITIPDSRYDDHRSQPNWIQKYIFPGGVLPSLTALCCAMTAHSGLLVESAQNIGPHYAETLKRWRERLSAAAGELASMGFDRAFQRKWQYYFALCEAQFSLRVLNDLQLVLVRGGTRSSWASARPWGRGRQPAQGGRDEQEMEGVGPGDGGVPGAGRVRLLGGQGDQRHCGDKGSPQGHGQGEDGAHGAWHRNGKGRHRAVQELLPGLLRAADQ
jgi:cyclopropane-fatty-acyl-phospholipid synthase